MKIKYTYYKNVNNVLIEIQNPPFSPLLQLHSLEVIS